MNWAKPDVNNTPVQSVFYALCRGVYMEWDDEAAGNYYSQCTVSTPVLSEVIASEDAIKRA